MFCCTESIDSHSRQWRHHSVVLCNTNRMGYNRRNRQPSHLSYGLMSIEWWIYDRTSLHNVSSSNHCVVWDPEPLASRLISICNCAIFCNVQDTDHRKHREFHSTCIYVAAQVYFAQMQLKWRCRIKDLNEKVFSYIYGLIEICANKYSRSLGCRRESSRLPASTWPCARDKGTFRYSWQQHSRCANKRNGSLWTLSEWMCLCEQGDVTCSLLNTFSSNRRYFDVDTDVERRLM